MKLLAISEHYFPRVGGTVNYVHETLSALAALGVDVELMVPGPMPKGMNPQPYRVHWIDAGYPAHGDPTRDQRYDFCRKVNVLALQAATGSARPDLLHVLFGLFVMETLDTARLRMAGLPSIATVHNVPPMECKVVPDTAPILAQLRETMRLWGVTWKNATRLKKHAYDLYVVPSEQVRGMLNSLTKGPVAVIGHGHTSDLQALMQPPRKRGPGDGKARLLTVGGYAPHKRQHIIPQVAARLREAGLEFEWDIVGPTSRLSGYYEMVCEAITDHGLTDVVRAHGSVSFAQLAKLYDVAHLYVQPSIEEGFCITALDAAAAGLPVIASPAGALQAIAEISGGMTVESVPSKLSDAITAFVDGDYWKDPHVQVESVRERFSWGGAATALLYHYGRRLQNANSTSTST